MKRQLPLIADTETTNFSLCRDSSKAPNADAEHRRSYSSRKSERSDHFGESHFSGARHPPNVPRPAQEPSFPSSSQSLGLEVPTLFAHFFSRCDAGRPSHRRWLLGAALSLAAAARGRCAAGLALHHRQRARCCVDFELPPTIPCRTPGGLRTQHPSLAPVPSLTQLCSLVPRVHLRSGGR